MSVSLQKGQKVSLSKEGTGLSQIVVGLGWDAASAGGGFLGSLFKSTPNIDCDASVLVLNNGKLLKEDDIVYFSNLRHSSNAIRHMGDNLTGDGDGDDEQIMIDLQNVPACYDRLVIVVNIYGAAQRKQHFGMIKNAFCRVVDTRSRTEICRYNLSEDYSGMTAMIFGEVYRSGNEWKFNAVGQGTTDVSLLQLADRFR